MDETEHELDAPDHTGAGASGRDLGDESNPDLGAVPGMGDEMTGDDATWAALPDSPERRRGGSDTP